MDNLVGIIIILALFCLFFIYKIIKSTKEIKSADDEIKKYKIEVYELSENNSRLKSELNSSQEQLEALKDKTDHLWKYASILDVESHNRSITIDAINKADSILEKAKAESQRILNNVKSEVSSLTQEARDDRLKAKNKLNEASAKSDEIIKNANDNAIRLVSSAEERAKEIAGSAYEAKEFAEKYASVVSAMKNKIKGYGDEWIIPNHSVLDEIAEEYEFKDAGMELKKARELTRTLMRADKAATCLYVEPNRRETAIRFVLDAFNGKVDTALSKVKNNNYGKLSQEIKDAFSLVNFNGGAFRDAKISDTFLQARLNELKWAVAVNEIIIEEKEEQRRIKEQLREEEKARKEYEKAIKEAEREEKTIRQAIEKATSELQAASEEQRIKLEMQISLLQEKYEEAEAKNQRAISMAQQTRAGHVYIISNIGSFGDDVFKIGMTRRLEPLDRVRELGDASVPFSFDVHAMIYSDDAPALENTLHRNFKDAQINKINSRKEFFNVSLKDIKSVVDIMNIETHWTLKAEAKEYRESLSLSRDKQRAIEDVVVA